MSLDDQINNLYKLPPVEFTAARNALAKTLSGDAAKSVKALAKPTVVPWAVNQLYWTARSAYDRLMKSGDALRTAQIAALKGKGSEIQRASDAHRKVLAEAVHEATRIAAEHSLKPASDDLSRMLEAISLSPERPEHPGRLTEVVHPAGFEALAGVTPAGAALRLAAAATKGAPAKPGPAAKRTKEDEARERAERAATAEREREEAERRKEAEDNLKAAERALERARTVEAKAREAFDKAQEDRRAAESALFQARKVVRDL